MREQASFGQCFGLFWKNYFNFKGCTSRQEYWFTIAWVAILTTPITIGGFFSFLGYVSGMMYFAGMAGMFILTMFTFILSFVLFIPLLSLLVRRFHDNGKSMFIPILFMVMSMAIPYLPDLTFNQFGTGHPNFITVIMLIIHISFIPVTLGLGIYCFVITLLPSKVVNNKYRKDKVEHIIKTEEKQEVKSFSKTL
ncbi:DUF805 domain-containing protein [Staphylococcus simulans]|uniref:DUF805 domain-containing protein n=1 Tax=Staphylococcus simulans TaxID=1286 RepID=UPI000D1FD06D|nr:DUF805 domain-containing protein [Staphylococcus simulans]MDY5060461.1 DUF805 domain-containing protein [Staphylococcus simulans]PTJ20231.1 hypothetical protein BU038_01960 [Staphylococcus simulans]